VDPGPFFCADILIDCRGLGCGESEPPCFPIPRFSLLTRLCGINISNLILPPSRCVQTAPVCSMPFLDALMRRWLRSPVRFLPPFLPLGGVTFSAEFTSGFDVVI